MFIWSSIDLHLLDSPSKIIPLSAASKKLIPKGNGNPVPCVFLCFWFGVIFYPSAIVYKFVFPPNESHLPVVVDQKKVATLLNGFTSCERTGALGWILSRFKIMLCLIIEEYFHTGCDRRLATILGFFFRFVYETRLRQRLSQSEFADTRCCNIVSESRSA